MKRFALLAALAALLGFGSVALASTACTGNPCICKPSQSQGLTDSELKP